MESVKKNIRKYLIKYLSNIRARKIANVYHRKVSKIQLDKDSLIDNEIVKLHREKWRRIYKRKVNLRWLYWYFYNTGINSPDFVPESIYYSIIEPVLNKSEFCQTYSDKNFYDLFYDDFLFPEILLRNIDGYFFNKDYQVVNIDNDNLLMNFFIGIDRFILKPSLESGGGTNVKYFRLNNGKYISADGDILTVKFLMDIFEENYVIQDIIHQNRFFSQFNPISLNTIKVFTYRSPITNKIHILHCLLRVGQENKYIDSTRAGGFVIGINKYGELNKYAVTRNGLTKVDKCFSKINGIDLEPGIKIPFFDKILETSIAIAGRNIHHRLLGLDMAVDQMDNIRCLEVNNMGNAINSFQLNNGPLFGEFTDEVIEYCRLNKHQLYSNYNF